MRDQIRRTYSHSLATRPRHHGRRVPYPTAVLCRLWHALNSKGLINVSANKLGPSQSLDERFVDTVHSVLDMVNVAGFSEAIVRRPTN